MFAEYYSKYLNLDAGVEVDNCLVCKSSLRDIPINKRFAYKIIITDYYGKRILSFSPSVSKNIINNICGDIKECGFDDILQSRQLLNSGYRISKMYRMTLNQDKALENISENIETEYISEYKKYVVRVKGSIISYCKISNIDFDYGNIVVWTEEGYRRKGYARELLNRMILKCKSEGIEPVYIVDSQNIGSIELAKSVGFELVQTEIIACEGGITVGNILSNKTRTT